MQRMQLLHVLWENNEFYDDITRSFPPFGSFFPRAHVHVLFLHESVLSEESDWLNPSH